MRDSRRSRLLAGSAIKIGDDGAPIASIASYQDLHRALRRRADQMGYSRRTLDDIAGLTGGLVEKILGPAQRKQLGTKSLGGILRALGVKLVMVEDQAACERVEEIAPLKRREEQVRHREASHVG